MKTPLLNWEPPAGVPSHICELDRDIWAMRGITTVTEQPKLLNHEARDFTFTYSGDRLVLTVKFGNCVTVYDCIVDRTFDFEL